MDVLVERLTGGGGGGDEAGGLKGEFGVVTYKGERSTRSASEEEIFAREESREEEDGETGVLSIWNASGRGKSEKGIEIVDCGM